MAQQQFAGLAVIIALAFMALALASCASSEHGTAESFGPVIIAPTEPEAGTPEFHDAAIGGDALRSRI